MRHDVQLDRASAVELLELHDRLDGLDEELRVQKIALTLTPLVSIVLAAPLIAVLWVNHARFFLAYPATFVVILGAILAVLTVERRRLKRTRDAVREELHAAEVAP
ncbi:MAG: hypothetical protein PVH96_12985 [Gemmatimonadota bacterium]|jgi:hypothetical protein